MICIEISLNGKLLWRAGIENATMLAPMIGSFVGSEDLADLHVSGMCELPGERSAHVDWGEPAVLRAGDVVRFAVGTVGIRHFPMKSGPPTLLSIWGSSASLKRLTAPSCRPTRQPSADGLRLHTVAA
jgi:hypothetical protein